MGTEDKVANIHTIGTAHRQTPKIITLCLCFTLCSLALI